MGNKRSTPLGNHSPRSVALLLLIAVLVGNLLFELWELLAYQAGMPEDIINECFLAVGLLGVAGFGIPLFRRWNLGNNTSLGERR